MIVINAILALYFVLGIFTLIFDDYFSWYSFIVPPLYWLFVFFTYKRNTKTALMRDLEIHGKPVEIVVTVTDEIIKQSQSTGSEFQLNYIDIKKAVKTKKYIYLWSKTNLLYSFKIESFTVGSASTFLAYLQSKSVRVK